jgi:signal transduction histidine kinase
VHGLYAWLRRHPRFVDGTLALGVLALGLIPSMWQRVPWIVVFIVVLAGAVLYRRSRPVGAFVAGIAAGAVQVATIRMPNAADLALMILLYTLAACRPRRVSLYGLAACLVGGLVACEQWGVFVKTKPSTAVVGVGALLAPPLLAWLLGDGVRWRRGYYLALEERAARLERERDALAQVAAAAERARIAREMHDVVAHHVSVMVVQADGGRYALDAAPDKTRDALTAISQTGRQALAEMRRLLGVLRGTDAMAAADTVLGPMPGIGDLEPLIEQTRAAGIPVTFSSSGIPPRRLDGGADLAAYRIVQEALTNVRKHGGPRAAATVAMRYGDDGLTIRVADDGRGAAASYQGPANQSGPGHGLAGMRERVALYGGKVTAGPLPGGGFEVIATVPATVPATGPAMGPATGPA